MCVPVSSPHPETVEPHTPHLALHCAATGVPEQFHEVEAWNSASSVSASKLAVSRLLSRFDPTWLWLAAMAQAQRAAMPAVKPRILFLRFFIIVVF